MFNVSDTLIEMAERCGSLNHMVVRVGTFNLNNLFSRYNFQAAIDESPTTDTGGITLSFDAGDVQARMFMGRLVKAKNEADTNAVAETILTMDADVLAVQEVEHIQILRQFNKQYLGGLYRNVVLVEGNDPRMIDVAVLSKLPVGPVTTHQTATHKNDPLKRVFGRDLLQVEILDDNGRKLFTLYNTHLKSHFVPYGTDPEEGAAKANQRRQRQAETIAEIISRQERPDSKFVLTGDMNDPPTSKFLKPMLTIDRQQLTNALENPEETTPAKPETPGQGDGPSSKAWTHRYNPPGPTPPKYELYDHIWVSPQLADKTEKPLIFRRTKHSGNGTDHDPATTNLTL